MNPPTSPSQPASIATDSAALQRTIDLLTRLRANPNDLLLLQQAANELCTHPELFAEAARKILPQPGPEFMVTNLWAASDPEANGSEPWSNVMEKVFCYPSKTYRPTSLEGIVSAVKEARDAKKTLRAVGTGHSFSNVAYMDRGGILLNLHAMNHVLPLDTSLLKDPSAAGTLFAAQSGMTIRDLNTALDDRGLALTNMGAFDGQTIAGAISTGTHGTGASLGPLANAVVSLVLVSETGAVYQIEPTNGITDPAKFQEKNSTVILKQDDDWFYSNVVAMGCMGVIYSYTIKVENAYHLRETRRKTTWKAIRLQLRSPTPGTLPALVTQFRHFEIDLNPYATDDDYSCIICTREVVQESPSGSRGWKNWLSGKMARSATVTKGLVDIFNLAPTVMSWMVDPALSTLEGEGFVDKSFKVLNLGDINNVPAYAIELSFDAADFAKSIEALLDLFAQAAEKGWYQPGPIGIRFVAAANAYLAPQYGRVSCMAECSMLKDVNNGEELLRFIERGMLDKAGVRVHWGLDLDELHGEQVHRMYEKYPEWLGVYRTLNSTGMFNNAFTKRLGISIPMN